MSASEVQDLVNSASDLISLPEISLRVNQIANDPNSTADDMGKVISQDPALVVRMLKIANSAYYGLSTEVETITRAISILGTNKIRDLVLSTSASQAFDGIPNELITMQDFWHHSLYCGLLAQILSKKSKKASNTESMFIAGLLHDIGQLLMFNQLPEKSHEAILLLMEGTEQLETFEAERHVFGFDHMEVGAELIKSWNLAPVLQECVRFHHEPQNAKDFPVEVALINIANAVAVMADFDSMNEDDIPMINPLSWELTGLTKNDLPAAIKEAQEEISEIEAVLFPSK